MYDQLLAQKNNLSHAYLLLGPQLQTKKELIRFLSCELGIESTGNPNVFIHDYPVLKIDHARYIQQVQSATSVGRDGYKIFIISFDSATVQAQNALLKSIEEPTPGTIYFCLVRDTSRIIPTLLSRVQTIESYIDEDPTDDFDYIDFYAAGFKQRSEMYSIFLGNSKKDIPADKRGAQACISRICSLIIQHKKHIPDWADVYRDIMEIQQFILDPSASVKQIFGYVAVRLPIVDIRDN